ncbi:outer membrane protein assembly factor BamA [Robertkochia solimangrovi]|uniref:outer membrane protein assembly factor BamA n=1 Tax=Robertkochia solimangrovi TaxID=2213046 RepID=UPI00117D6DD2|nr:outer membrane protein assembly factor BamA [Robertkochia solimangrovi]TRZ44420.1 outer membrane protein assembly factor BamA [Robertkochia solimangrovi]
MFQRYFGVIILLLFFTAPTIAQETTFDKGKKYILGGIEVTGLKSFNEQTVITYTDLRPGQEITIPGEEISNVINKLWTLQLFSDINVYQTKIEDGKIWLELEITELPTLSDIKVNGIKEKKVEDVLKEADVKKGKKVTEGFLANTKTYLENKYRKDGYLNSKVYINTIPDTTADNSNSVKMVINIDNGEKVKVKDISFEGNEKLSNKRLKRAMKNTKEKQFGRFWKKSKFIPEDYKADLTAIIDAYKENGYRDARILKDTISNNSDNTIDIDIKVEEGDRYYFGNIDFVGNSAYTDEFLHQYLGIKKGETYNGVLMAKRISEADPDANTIENLYQNNGYLFSQINTVEVSAQNDTIDFEIRINEGKEAYLNHVSVVGNDKTNDHVIYRELRTRPGQLYSKERIVRSIRELGQLGFFDPETIEPKIENPNAETGTVDIAYHLEEKGSSQIELQGGYGGGGFIGTLGLSFSNFSIRNIFNKDAYKPVPMGDGQRLSLRLQASRYFQTYSFSFSEPWMGGKKPVQFSVSLSRTLQFRYNYLTGDADKDQRFTISGITVGLAKRLQWPDDSFQLSHALSYQHYDLQNYYTGLFTFGDGYSQNLSYTIALTRNNTRINPIFPTGGSQFSISAKLSPPYSLFNDVDYAALEDDPEYQTPDSTGEMQPDQAKIDQERYKWLEFYKIKFSGTWYTNLIDKLVLKSNAEFGFLGAYNNDRGVIPFERFFLGGDGLGNFTLDGRENIQLRGYPNQSLSGGDGETVYNKFSLELRYPITLKPTASIYALSFMEGGASYDGFKQYNPFQLKRSAGVGLRIFMPAFGLLGIDFGYGFDNVPGQQDPSGWQTHFIIGQQF